MALTFPYERVKMTVFLQSLRSRVAKAVTKPFSVPTGDEDTWSDITTKEFDANAKVHLYCFKPWTMTTYQGHSLQIRLQDLSHLVVTHEGTSQVKRAKIYLLCS